VSYLDLVADPVQTAGEIYRHFGWTFDELTRTRMKHWHAGQAERRRTESRHQYTLADYGLTEDQVDGAFAGYAEYRRITPLAPRTAPRSAPRPSPRRTR
jgi:hypothetical protein